MSDLLKLSGITVQYSVSKRIRNAVDNVSLTIPSKGYTLGLVGESGSGKTTLGLSIMNLIEPPGKISTGGIQYMDSEVLKMDESKLRRFRWEEVSMVFQSAMNSLNPVKTVSNHVAEVLMQHKQISKLEARETALSLLTSVGIKSDRANAYSHELSGGMRQRVVIAMALALSPKLLIADEPTSALDVVVQRQILALLKKEVSQKDLSMMFITHEIALLEGLVENVAVMFEGEIVELGPVGKVAFSPMHPYTEMLISSLLTLKSKRESLTTLSQNTRNARSIPDVGCKFANRCKYAFDRCRIERPIFEKKEEGRFVACHKYNN